MDLKNAVPTDVLKDIIQVGIVVEDLDATLDNMRQVLGVEPDFLQDFVYTGVKYRGEPIEASARVACYNQFKVQLEFMQPVGESKTIWKDHLDDSPRPGYGLHHLRFADVEDNDAVTALLKTHGVDVYQEGNSIVHPGGKFTYYDTMKQLGFVIEVVTKFDD